MVLVFRSTADPKDEVLIRGFPVFEETSIGELTVLIFALSVLHPEGKLLLRENTDSGGFTVEEVMFQEILKAPLGTWLFGNTRRDNLRRRASIEV